MSEHRPRRTRRRRALAAAAALALGSALAVAASSAPASAADLDNPYSGATEYVNPEWSAHASAEPGGGAISDEPTFVWLDRMAAIDGVDGGMGLADHLDAAIDQGANLAQFVIYDLPNRDCAALASNGEIPHGGLATYEQDYIDPIVDIMSRPEYANLRIVTIIEPDSLPNLVTNAGGTAGSTTACADAKASTAEAPDGEYIDGVGYALAHLGALPNVYNYIDAGHHGWLGWDSNFGPAAQTFHQAATANGASVDDVTGFITNTANYSALTEPYFKVTDTVNGTSVRQSKWVDWNNYVDELSFAQAFRGELVSAGFRSNIGMLIDTGRNGWGGSERPTGPGPTTSVDAYVDGGRIDRRIHLGNWCNQDGAGIGERPQSAPASGIDAYVWAKPPGESDGSSQPVDNDEGKGFDQMCDPSYGGNARNGYNPTGALPNAPLAGHWFSAEFQMLLANAYPALDGSTPPGGGGDDTEAPTAPNSVRVSATTSGSVSLTWAASTDNVGVTAYEVYRGTQRVGSSATTAFTDTGLSASTSYTYTVKARDAAGNTSPASAAVTATTDAGGGNPPGDGQCSATLHVDNDWGSGFTATVTVSNPGADPTSSWSVSWTWGGNQQITNSWSATVHQSGASVTATDAGYNAAIAAGGSTSFGFQGSYSGANAVPSITCSAS